MNDYRRNWCRLREIVPEGDDGEFYSRTLRQYAEMLPQIRRHFQRIRPASYRMVRGLEDGDDFDLDRAVEHRVARSMGNSPDPRVYKARKKEARDVATLFLLDMSASTDEPIHQDNRRFTDSDDRGRLVQGLAAPWRAAPAPAPDYRRQQGSPGDHGAGAGGNRRRLRDHGLFRPRPRQRGVLRDQGVRSRTYPTRSRRGSVRWSPSARPGWAPRSGMRARSSRT